VVVIVEVGDASMFPSLPSRLRRDAGEGARARAHEPQARGRLDQLSVHGRRHVTLLHECRFQEGSFNADEIQCG